MQPRVRAPIIISKGFPAELPACRIRKKVIPITTVSARQIASAHLLGTSPAILRGPLLRSCKVTHAPRPKSLDVNTMSTGKPNAIVNVKLLMNMPVTIPS